MEKIHANAQNKAVLLLLAMTIMDASKEAAVEFLTSLLNKTLRITTTDTRLFVGEFKCTDADRNMILSCTHEYRLPTPPIISDFSPPTTQAASKTEPEKVAADEDNPEKMETGPANAGRVVQDMTSRYLGLVVVPGEFITKIEVEEFASQVNASGGSRYANLDATVSPVGLREDVEGMV